MHCRTQGRSWRGIVIALACLCLTLQQAFIGLHLSLHAHSAHHADGSAGGHEHAHVAVHVPVHAHDAAHVHEDDAHEAGGHRHDGALVDAPQESEHEPHPADDHLEQSVGERVHPSFGRGLAAQVPTALGHVPSRSLVVRLPGRRSLRPRVPPPRGTDVPRAPPALV